MVNSLSITFMALSALISFLFPVILIIYFRRRDKISFKVAGVGALTFIVFSQILEKILHAVVLGNKLLTNPIAIAVYGALAAGVFEEVGRFVFMKYLLKGYRRFKDGIAFGLGHGGIEAILIGVIANIQYIAYSQLINSGNFDQAVLSKIGNNEAAKQALQGVKDTLINTAPVLFSISWIERVFALTMHIGFTLIVLYGLKQSKIIYLFAAILIHAFVDFFPALYQAKILSLPIIELLLVVFAVITVIFIVKFKNKFNENQQTA